ncbi:uncharacterized protein LOC103380434 isoform X2 [Cynoglossus semilaevis]|uniref:uncharacterized protein LOC103380434 isoform X2 n=1 Tax=Cynoglossus semilaevis TaxID=244447 RepID=UPI000497CD29|nr:uncharacterized protein LOC103380434 isoform X2 [Cynoglossus semilaevis]XP_024912299.1 uncharacterized protein LOC103380434 isoform X2 [Cynoglossus semilaevis]
MCRLTMSQFLQLSVLCLHLLPSVLCDNLRCYYSPIMEKQKSFKPIVTECPPDELCFRADGRFGNHSALSARGCMAKKDCSQVHKLRFKGSVYTMSYACCEGPYCNSCLVVRAYHLLLALTLVTVVASFL